MGNDLRNLLSQVTSARAMNGWSDYYSNIVNECRIKLYGKMSLCQNVLSRNWSSYKRIRYHNSDPDVVKKESYGYWRNSITLLKLAWSKVLSYRTQRTIWFLLIVSLVTLNILSQLFDWKVLQPEINSGAWYEKYILYIPILLVFGMAYSFAIKNYRIYSNRLEQYEHRAAVAATTRDIITSLPDEKDQDIRKSMAAVAAVALFEHKSTGHLTKREAETTGLLEIAKSIFNAK
jgi:hypothetical protein